MEHNYQIEHIDRALPKCLECYLFVNPIGHRCHQTEQTLLNILQYLPVKTDIHILCFHNQKNVSAFMQHLHIDVNNLAERNRIFQTIYKAALAYKAASLQGKRKGRDFLMRMQTDINSDISRFSTEYVLTLAEQIGLDVATFRADWQSDYVRQLYLKDQKIAADMGATCTPALVMFEHSIDGDGIMVADTITEEVITEQLNLMLEACSRTRLNHQQCLAIVKPLFTKP
ncbi:DsbA family protein [Aerococcaceae bacterium NML190938]|nr:DsbA family protein [Aerococcaceae bacterium NML190938]